MSTCDGPRAPHSIAAATSRSSAATTRDTPTSLSGYKPCRDGARRTQRGLGRQQPGGAGLAHAQLVVAGCQRAHVACRHVVEWPEAARPLCGRQPHGLLPAADAGQHQGLHALRRVACARAQPQWTRHTLTRTLTMILILSRTVQCTAAGTALR